MIDILEKRWLTKLFLTILARLWRVVISIAVAHEKANECGSEQIVHIENPLKM